jgi:hypothetical protein
MAHRIISKLTKLFNRNSDERDFYAPLDANPPTIRLLRLLPGYREDDIHAQLQPCSIAEAQNRYTTISYTWGSAEAVPTRLIRCNDKLIFISENLFTALRTLRRHDQPILLWADALCINQDDIAERTHQVSLMGEIYCGSKETVIWLGEPEANEDVGDYLLKSYAVQKMANAPEKYTAKDVFLDPTWTGGSSDDELRNAYLLNFKRSSADAWVLGPSNIPGESKGPDIFGAFCLLQDFAEGASYPTLSALDHEKTIALRQHGVTSNWHGLVVAKAHVRGSRSSRVWAGLARLMSRPWVRFFFLSLCSKLIMTVATCLGRSRDCVISKSYYSIRCAVSSMVNVC